MQRSGILGGPGIIVVGVHGLGAATYVLLFELALAPRLAACLGGTNGECAKRAGSLAARRACYCFFALPALALAALAATWSLLQPSTPQGTWGGASWAGAAASNASARVTFPAGGAANLCFAMTNYTVPAADTSYSCRAFAFPPGVALHATGEYAFRAPARRGACTAARKGR